MFGEQMKTTSAFLLFVAIPLVAISGLETDIAQENRVILKSAWMPTNEQTAKALKSIQVFLENPKNQDEWSANQIKQILANTSKYRVQFIGVIKNDHKLLHCNFFPVQSRGEFDYFKKWKEEEIFVCDGGFWFWQIDYDIESGDCTNFSTNGEG